MGIFERVFLKTNVKNIISMVFQTFHINTSNSDATYTKRMTDDPSYRTHQRQCVQCTECVVDLESVCLATHQYWQNSNSSIRAALSATPNETPSTCRVYLPRTAWEIVCSVEGCRGRATNRTSLRTHFTHHHARDTIIILDEGNWPQPWCDQCDMFPPWK